MAIEEAHERSLTPVQREAKRVLVQWHIEKLRNDIMHALQEAA